MNLAYVDTSCLVAIAFGERAAGRLANRLRRFDRLLSSNLLEAELRSALAREGVPDGAGPLLSGLTWVHPDRPLTPEFDRVLAAGYLKGADLWHLATAVFLAPAAHGLAFLSLDRRQREVAARLGFTV
jgi:hypothetical protein